MGVQQGHLEDLQRGAVEDLERQPGGGDGPSDHPTGL